MAAEREAELLRLVKGSPQPELSVRSLADRMGASEAETRAPIERLESQGRVRRDGERLLVVESATSQAPPNEPIA